MFDFFNALLVVATVVIKDRMKDTNFWTMLKVVRHLTALFHGQ
jgi:hypothetical protein